MPTLVGIHSYDASANVLTSVGGTAGSPIGCVDWWNADKAGTLALHVRTGLTAVDAAPVSFTRALRPTDRYMLGGNCVGSGGIWLVVANWATFTDVTIRLVGTDFYGNSQTEDVTVTGNGNYAASKFFRTLTQSWIVAVNGSGSFDYSVIQGQWGVLWKNGVQFAFDCGVQIGDGNTASYFTTSGVQWSFNSFTSTLYGSLTVMANATATFGTLKSATDKTVSNGVAFYHNRGATNLYEGKSGCHAYFYGCSFVGNGSQEHRLWSYIDRMWHCSFYGGAYPRNPVGTDIYDSYVVGAYYAIKSFSGISLGKFQSVGSTWALFLDSNGAFTITDFYARGTSSGLLDMYYAPNSIFNFVNPDVDIVKFNFGAGTGKVNWKFTFDLATDSGATAVLKDKDGNVVFSVVADGNGNIAQQIVSEGFFDYTHGGNLQDMQHFSPFVLEISKPGCQTYREPSIVFAEKAKWRVRLVKAKPILSYLGQPIVNLNATDPENALVLPL